MKIFNNIKDLESKLRKGEIKLGNIDYIKVENIIYVMENYDSFGKEVIWKEENPGSWEKGKIAYISLNTFDRYSGLEDAVIEEYYI